MIPFSSFRRQLCVWCVFLPLLSALLLAVPSRAQVIRQYALSDTLGTYTPLTGGTGILLNQVGTGMDDNYSLALPIPFPFVFGALPVTTYSVNTNGWLTFGPSGVDPYNIPLSRTRNQLVAFLGMDLTARGATYSAKVTGTAPARILVIEASNFSEYGISTATGNAQVWLYEGSNAIEIHYGLFTPDWTNGTVAGTQVGLRGNDTTDVRSVGGNWAQPTASNLPRQLLPLDGANGILPINGLILRFALPAGADFMPPTIGALTIAPPGGQCAITPHTVTATVTDASGVGDVALLVSVGGNTPDTLPMSRITPGSTTFSAIVPAVVGVVTVRVQAADTSANANVGTSPPASYQDALLTIDAGADQTINAGSSATLQATTSRELAVRITEFTLSRAGTGSVAFPAYVPATAADFLELTNLAATVADLSGYELQVLSAGIGARTYTFPLNTTIVGRATLLLHLGAGRDSAAVNYYNTDGATDAFFSGSNVAFVLTSPSGRLFDAVIVNNFVPVAPISPTDWSGPGVASPTGQAGSSLRGADVNKATNWIISTGSTPQSLNVINPGLPTSAPPTPVIWTGGLLSVPSTSNPLGTPVHTTPGTFQYVASTTDGTCTVRDTVTITVVTPGTLVADFTASATSVNVGDMLTLTDHTLGIPTDWRWQIEPAAGALFVNGTTATSQNPQVQLRQGGTYIVTLIVGNGITTDTLTKADYLAAAVRYCVSNLQTSSCATAGNGYINSIRILGTGFQNLNTGCASGATAPGYTAYPASGSTTTTLTAGSTYTLSVTSSTNGSVGAWLDYNSDGVFDATEFIRVTDQSTPNVAATVVFTVPDTAIVASATGLRIRNGISASTIGPPDACTQRATGETEDYLVKIVAAPSATHPDYVLGQVEVYPNPSTGLVRVRLPDGGSQVTELTLLDALGRVMHTQRAAAGAEAELALQHLPAGVYSLRVQRAGAVTVRRVVLRK